MPNLFKDKYNVCLSQGATPGKSVTLSFFLLKHHFLPLLLFPFRSLCPHYLSLHLVAMKG